MAKGDSGMNQAGGFQRRMGQFANRLGQNPYVQQNQGGINENFPSPTRPPIPFGYHPSGTVGRRTGFPGFGGGIFGGFGGRTGNPRVGMGSDPQIQTPERMGGQQPGFNFPEILRQISCPYNAHLMNRY